MGGLELALPLIIGPAVSLVVEAAKRAPAVPFSGKSRAGVALALLVVSLGARAGLAWVNGDLGSLDWATELRILLEGVSAALVAAGGYSLVKR